MRHFPFFLFIYLSIFFWGGGEGGRAKLSLMIATLKKKRTKHPPSLPHPPENKDELHKSQNMLFIWGRWGGGGS